MTTVIKTQAPAEPTLHGDAATPTVPPVDRGGKFGFGLERPQTPTKLPSDSTPVQVQQIVINPTFRFALIIATGLTLLTFFAAIFLSFVEPSNANIEKAIDYCWGTFKLGFGAIIGLIGGKAL